MLTTKERVDRLEKAFEQVATRKDVAMLGQLLVERFDRLDTRFDRLEDRVDKIETRLDKIEQILDD